MAAVAGGAASALERDEPRDAEVAVPGSPVTPVLSARRVPALLAAPVADRRLEAGLAEVLARQPGTSCLTVASAGRTLVSRDPDRAFVPASLHKLLTAVAATEVLGLDFRFRTTVAALGPPRDGVVAGDLWIVGGGDPLLATGAYAARFRNQPQIRTPVESLADAVTAAGVRRVEGRLVGDESRYDTDRYPDAWPQRFIAQDQSGPLSALTVNDAWAAFPPDPDATVPDEAPAADPAVHAAAVLDVLLAERGTTVAGGAVAGVAPPGAVEIARVESPPLEEVLEQMLAESDNQTAELLLKEMAVARGRPGTTAHGVAVAAEAIAALGLADPGPVMADGSGLASANALTCGLVQAILDRAGPASPLARALPVAGRTGTLARRFVDSPVTGRLRAKTGTLNQVTALAGYLETPGGAGLTFSFIVNLAPDDRVGDDDLVRQDELAAVLARYPEGPSLDVLGPQPPLVEGSSGG